MARILNMSSSILQLMIDRRDVDLVKATLAAGANINQVVSETTPLSTAVSIGSLEMVDYLLRLGADSAPESATGRSVRSCTKHCGWTNRYRPTFGRGSIPQTFSVSVLSGRSMKSNSN